MRKSLFLKCFLLWIFMLIVLKVQEQRPYKIFKSLLTSWSCFLRLQKQKTLHKSFSMFLNSIFISCVCRVKSRFA